MKLYPRLPPLETWLAQGKVLLLLDALNEMPHRDTREYFELVALWRGFVQEAAAQGNRLVFTCRSLDYSARLSAPELRVPQVQVQPMDGDQMRQFMFAYCRRTPPSRGQSCNARRNSSCSRRLIF